MMQTDATDYEQAAPEYAAHRQIHAGVFRELSARVVLGSASRVLEIGCGTGNYIAALAGTCGCSAYGLDPSFEMLTRVSSGQVHRLVGRAQRLCLAQCTFDLVFSVDVIHHVGDKAAFYQEAARILRPGGWLCTVTDSEEMIRRREVLSSYFPETVEIEMARYPCIAQLEVWMDAAGLEALRMAAVEEPYEITSAQPFRDRAYSSLHLISTGAWRAGLAHLERDLARGPVRGISRYACLWGRKPVA